MVKHSQKIDKEELLKIAYEQLGINYFILLGLSISKMVYKEVYYLHNETDGGLEAVLLKRNSGNLQLMTRKDSCSPEVCKEFKILIESLDFKELIASKKTVKALRASSLFKTKKDGAYISTTSKPSLSHTSYDSKLSFKVLKAEDVPAIEYLYKLVFESFTPAPVMEKKLNEQRGRGLGLYKNKELIAVAQTDFETDDTAIIVGVATHPDYQHKGYGYLILSELCKPLVNEDKSLVLHYNNEIAGKLYQKMNFTIIDQIGHYKRE